MQQTILIVEDDADIAEGLHYNLKREGFRTVIAESGEKGLRLALDEKNPPSLVLLDLMLPGMTKSTTLTADALPPNERSRAIVSVISNDSGIKLGYGVICTRF